MNLKFGVSTKLKSSDKVIDKAKKVLYLSMNKMEELAKNNVPVNTGRLKNSIQVFPAGIGSRTYVLSDGVDYGIHIEYGTSPHYAPIRPLKFWSKRVLGDEKAAYAVRAAIAKRGTPAQPFFRPALSQVRAYWRPVFWKQVMAQA